MDVKILQAATEEHLDQIRSLMLAFVEWHKQRHTADLALIDQYFNKKAFDAELATLPGKYAPLKGRLLLALEKDEPAGCVGLHAIDARICEMKRMFVYPQFHGRGIGRALAETLIREAKSIGYDCIRLDTGPKQVEAQDLYRNLGFKEIQPYYDLPEELREWLLFMELKL